MRLLKAIFIVVMLFISSTALAFDPPDPSRWIWVDSNDKFGLWVDKETVQFYSDNRVTYWSLMYSVDRNKAYKVKEEVDYNRMETRSLYFITFDGNGNVEDSFVPESQFRPISPDSVKELEVRVVQSLKH